MSQQVEIKTQIKDLTQLKATLNELSYTYFEGENLKIQSYDGGGENAKVDLTVKLGRYDNRIGYRWNEKTKEYDLIGDFYSTGTNQEAFCKKVKHHYMVAKVESLVRNKHYSVVDRKKVVNGETTIICRSM